jgi:peptidyl-prolyl cis-trans isomerase C
VIKSSILAIAGALALVSLPSLAQDKVLATVNGHPITEADLKHVEAEIGSDLASIPAENRRQIMVEFLIQNELFATAADTEKLGEGKNFDSKVAYYKRRALRDTFFERKVREAVTEADAKTLYEKQAELMKDNPQIRVRHILVEKEEDAKEIKEKIVHGADFAKLAAEKSKDPGSAPKGGDLGYLQKGQTVKAFDETIMKLKPGDISDPVKTEFGWHVIKVEERRALPPFDSLKERIIATLIQEKAQKTSEELRGKAKIEIQDADLKKALEKKPAK